jgi:regulator of cell morphogenesis and NO signaling
MIQIPSKNGDAIVVDPSTCTVAELVGKDYRTADVFRSFGIDYCCGGKKPILEAAAETNQDPQPIIAALESLSSGSNQSEADVTKWSIPLLSNYIVEVHHGYVREALPSLKYYANRVANAHGRSDERLFRVNELVEVLDDAMTSHMREEEDSVFPAMIAAAKGQPSDLDMVKLIDSMEAEHVEVGGVLAELRMLTDDFTPPAHACNSYRVLFASLADFEKDLHRHVFLENHILFAKYQRIAGLVS